MSRSNNTEVKNPVTKWFEWSGADGSLSYYDREAKEKINIPLPFTFLLLDKLSTIKGYDKQGEAGIYANEVKNTTTDILKVKNFKGIDIAEGLYKDIKEVVVSKGGKYSQSCYIAFYDENKSLVIGNIAMTGSSLGGGENKKEKYEVGAWLGFCKNNADLYKKAIVMERDERVCVNGATKFYCPKFKSIDVSPATNDKAIELDKELQEYFSVALKHTPETTTSEREEVRQEQPANNNHYETMGISKREPAKEAPVVDGGDSDDDSELPF